MFSKSVVGLLLAITAWYSVDVHAQYARRRPFFQASRALAMGDAYTAFDQGYEAVYYNPAGVAKNHPVTIKYFDIEGTATSSLGTYFKSNLLTPSNLANIAANVAANPDLNHAFGLAFLPQFLVKNFSVGVLARSYLDAIYLSETFTMEYYATTDLALYAQMGVALFGGIIKLGVGAKALNRAEVNRSFTQAEIEAGTVSYSTSFQEGTGYGADLGLLLTAPVAGLPTLGIAVLDAGNTRLLDRRILFAGSSGAAGTPANLQQRVNVGLGLNLKHAAGVRSALDLDLKDVLVKTGGYQERVHVGWELDINKAVFIRAGLNQGRYFTAGFAFNVVGVGIEFATYGENLLVGTGLRRDDRKYVGRYTLAF